MGPNENIGATYYEFGTYWDTGHGKWCFVHNEIRETRQSFTRAQRQSEGLEASMDFIGRRSFMRRRLPTISHRMTKCWVHVEWDFWSYSVDDLLTKSTMWCRDKWYTSCKNLQWMSIWVCSESKITTRTHMVDDTPEGIHVRLKCSSAVLEWYSFDLKQFKCKKVNEPTTRRQEFLIFPGR